MQLKITKTPETIFGALFINKLSKFTLYTSVKLNITSVLRIHAFSPPSVWI